MIELLDDILEEIANKLGIYEAQDEESEDPYKWDRNNFISHLKQRIEIAVKTETAIENTDRGVIIIGAGDDLASKGVELLNAINSIRPTGEMATIDVRQPIEVLKFDIPTGYLTDKSNKKGKRKGKHQDKKYHK